MSKTKVLPGLRVGLLTVLRDTGERKSRYTVWECQCDCGGSIKLDTRYLQRGTIADCGCKTKVKPGQKDLTGQRFGMLVVVEQAGQQKQNGVLLWKCRCDCGNEVLAPSGQLLKGYKKSCNCLWKPPLKDWVGKRFGKLEVISYAGKKKGSHFWECRCDCGNVATVCQSNLKIGKTLSCGCLVDISKNIHYLNGTSIEAIESKAVPKNNTSGVRGVYLNKRNGKWVAQITFKQKTYYLGSYLEIQDAIDARKQAEEKLFGEFLDWYYNNDLMKSQG